MVKLDGQLGQDAGKLRQNPRENPRENPEVAWAI